MTPPPPHTSCIISIVTSFFDVLNIRFRIKTCQECTFLFQYNFTRSWTIRIGSVSFSPDLHKIRKEFLFCLFSYSNTTPLPINALGCNARPSEYCFEIIIILIKQGDITVVTSSRSPTWFLMFKEVNEITYIRITHTHERTHARISNIRLENNRNNTPSNLAIHILSWINHHNGLIIKCISQKET